MARVFRLTLEADLQGRVRLGFLELEGLAVRETDPELSAALEAQARELRLRYGSGRSGEVPGAADARALYRSLGMDPTKTRPSNEALLRRALRGDSLSGINTLVDAVNLCSLREQLPFGLYDRERIAPPVVLRRGRAGEAYEGIRKGSVNLEGRPVLADSQGPFGNPSADSARSMIRLDTQRALLTVYAPAGCETARLERVLDVAHETLARHCGGRVEHREVVPGGA